MVTVLVSNLIDDGEREAWAAVPHRSPDSPGSFGNITHTAAESAFVKFSQTSLAQFYTLPLVDASGASRGILYL